MQVVLRAQQALADRRVLDVPSGPSVAELRRPERLTGLARLPEDEVARVALVGIGVQPRDRVAAQDVRTAPGLRSVGDRGEAADDRAACDVRNDGRGTPIATLLAHARDAIRGDGSARGGRSMGVKPSSLAVR